MASTLRVLPLGGLGEIGKNMMVLEYEDAIVVVDVGLRFPTAEMVGIDLVLPDFSYLRGRVDDIEGIVVTHGHEDHLGSLPYVERELGEVQIASHTGIRDDDVDVAEAFDCGADLGPVAHVGDQDLVVVPRQLRDQRPQLILAAGDEAEQGAAPRERLGERPAEPARCARDQHPCPVSDVHRRSS